MIQDTRFQTLAEHGLFQPEIQAKLDATRRAEILLAEGRLDLAFTQPPRPAGEVRFPERPILVEPRQLPRRSLHTVQGRIALLHAVAHIEFTAIVLAWDIAYRFREMPAGFAVDWLGVAIEEARHFEAVRQRLRELGADYGDLPAHRGLWDLAEQTAGDVLHRLALVPRFMEARGLDVTPPMIEKLTAEGDADSVAILDMILREEVGHVALGSRWFRHVAAQRGLDPESTYFDLVRAYIKGGVRGPFNQAARRAAGFTDSEMSRLGSLETATSIRE
jgi:uncharacterized ferritin-like protein (DUF455 family)